MVCVQLDKEPEQFNEEDLRLVFDYEAKVAFRNEERNKYRRMLHAEYAKLSQVLNEGVVKFNMRASALTLIPHDIGSATRNATSSGACAKRQVVLHEDHYNYQLLQILKSRCVPLSS